MLNRLGFRRVTGVRFGLALFLDSVHRTGLADFLHPALGKTYAFAPEDGRYSVATRPGRLKNGGTVWEDVCNLIAADRCL